MKKQNQRQICTALGLLTAFMLWTAAISLIDVQAVGPLQSTVGLATLNCFFHNLTGVHMSLYTITDWLGLVPLSVMFAFALLGLSQWIKRRNFFKVDHSILLLGGFYVVVIAVYVFFERCVVNYRPVLIEGVLEASYPSSTTMLVLCVMPTAMMQFRTRIKNHTCRSCVNCVITAFIVFMVTFRLVSGVHWVTDVIGGVLLSAGLITMYASISNLKQKSC